MLQLTDSDAPDSGDRRGAEPMSGGVLGSLLLHLLVLLLALLGLPWLMQAPPPALKIMPVDLVQLAETTASPPAADIATLPQQRAEELQQTESPTSVPLAQTPPPQAAQRQREEAPAADLPITSRSAQQSRSSPARTVSKPAAPSVDSRPQRAPADALSRRLEQLAQLRQQPPPIPADPRRQEGTGDSNLAASSAAVLPARDASYGVKDFLRAQIERHWNPDRQALQRGDWQVSIHILLGRDGSVKRADIVDTPPYGSDRAYDDFARSARDAVILSSPLSVPPGAYKMPEDITIDFDLKQDSH